MSYSSDTIPKKLIFGVIFTVTILFCIFATIGINDNGQRTVVQWPSGTTFVKFQPGIYIAMFGKTTPYSDVVTVGVVCNQIPIRYQDGGKGCVEGVVRIALPADENSMLTLHRAVRSEDGLRTKLLYPEVRQALNLTAGLMTSEESYAIKRNDFAFWAEDQLANGKYVTELVTRIVKTTEGETQERKVPAIKYDEDGLKLHHDSPFAEYFLRVTGFQITDWNFEQKTLDQISEKREAEMAIITAKANANKAVWQQKQIKADGEKEVERVKYEQLQEAEKQTIIAQREKDVAVIAAEKIVAVNRQQLEAAEIDVKTAKQEGIATKTRADAEAYAKKAVIDADGALDKKLATYEKVQAKWAEAYSNRKVPQLVFGGEGGDTNTDTSQFQAMLQAMMAKQLVVDPNITK